LALQEGLTGLVTEQVRPWAVPEVSRHPRFKYFQEIGEDALQSYLGVPLIDRGVVRGVRARNLWWRWDPKSAALFRDVDPAGWQAHNHNPVPLLSEIPLAALDRRCAELVMHGRINYAYRREQEYLSADETGGAAHAGVLQPRPVAYISAEFGQHESLPVYSGGLGVLTGDHIKSAADLDVLLVGSGSFYVQGYFCQQRDKSGWQREEYLPAAVNQLTMELAMGKNGEPVIVQIETRGVPMIGKVWRVKVACVDLLLLDSNVESNAPEDRELTPRLYGPDGRVRIDLFNADLTEEHLGPLRDALELPLHELMALGRENPGNPQEDFCMTVLGLKLSRRANAVSALHGEVSRSMRRGLYPCRGEDEVPIGHIKNGVHVPTWFAPEMVRLYDLHLGVGWQHSGEPAIWEGIEAIDDGELGKTHLSLKANLLDFVRWRAPEQGARRGEPTNYTQRLRTILSPDALTIGFARRFATYKRPNLVLKDIEQLAAMVNDPKQPVQFMFAGKAHPRDEPGKCVLQEIPQMMRGSQFADRFVFVEDYDINVGRHRAQGVDVWLNNPRRPLEASATSGQKVVLNGGLNPRAAMGAPVFDGEAIQPVVCEVHDTRDGGDLYRVLGEEVSPLFDQHDRNGLTRGWIKRTERTIRTLGWRFNANRMVMDYALKCYVPAAGSTSSDMQGMS
jgi:glucan phosphorylase